ncbi:LysM peptidoglycan-binding domain-containing protein [Puniceicoccaceae bacterium K14]|nr:LysM peptidoglycan-binding domain-containing protein [Puniceicoccaceae bacterium K14]
MSLSRRQFVTKLLAGSLGIGTIAQASAGSYTIKKGDTLSDIAKRHGVSVSQLKKANNLSDDLIIENQVLALPQNANDSLARAIETTKNLKVPLRNWELVVAHHSAIEYGNAQIYHQEHRRRGMLHGLAYHFVIGNGIDSGDGEIEFGDRWLQQLAGGHVRSQSVNDRGIGICLVGNLENHAPSYLQIQALTQLVDFLKRDVFKKKFAFTEHRKIDPGHTVCPGRHFPSKTMLSRYT